MVFMCRLVTVKSPKRASLFKDMTPESVDLEVALSLLSLPRELGNHPDTGKPISVGVGRFGPYLLHDSKYTSLPAGESPLEIGINRAVDVLANAAAKGKGGKGGSKLEPLKKTRQTPGRWQGSERHGWALWALHQVE